VLHITTHGSNDGGLCRALLVDALTLFAVVHPFGMIAAEPLAPSVQLPPVVRLVAGQLGIAHEPQVSLKARMGKGMSQASHPGGNTPCLGIGDRAFKREYVRA